MRIYLFILLLLLCGLAFAETQRWLRPMQEQVPKTAQGDGGDGALHPFVWACTPGMKDTFTFNYARFPSPPPGAYDFIIRLKLADNTKKTPVLSVGLNEEPGAQLGSYTLYASDFPVAGAYHEFRIPLLKTGTASIVAWQLRYLGNVPLLIDQVTVVPADARADAPAVAFTRFRTGKLLYWSDERPTIEVSVRNTSPKEQTVTLEVTGEAGLGQEVLRAEQTLTLAPDAETETQVVWPLRRPFGFTARGRLLRDGQVLDSAQQIFAVADNFNMVSQYGSLYPNNNTPEEFRNVLEGYRAAYIGAFEVDFWAACDFSGMAPQQDKWLGGQGIATIDRGVLQQAVKSAKAAGIRALTYGDMWLCGPAGFEWARTHPEQTIWGPCWYGGGYNVDLLDAQRALDEKKAREIGGWSALTPNVADPDVQRFAAEEILRSISDYGWDGIRYDNYGLYINGGKNLLGQEFTAKLAKPVDEANADLIRRLRATLTAKYPRFVYGDNAMSRYGTKPPDAKWTAEAEKGGMIMDEEIGQRSAELGWTDIATHAVLATRTARASGGYQLDIITNTMPRLCWAARPYPYILTIAAGAHVAYASPAHGMTRYCAFAMRYGELLYDLAARPLEGEVIPFRVEAPVWWRDYVTVRPLPEGKLQYLVSLINPPGAPQVTDVITPPKVLERLPVTFRVPPGERVTGAWAVSPEPSPHAEKLDAPAGETVTLTVPRLEYWTMLVVETAPEVKK
jgi:hypothetical protein